MSGVIEEAKILRDSAKLQRKRGDALLRRARKQAGEVQLRTLEDGRAAFRTGVGELKNALGALVVDGAEVAEELAETWGALGGMLRRLPEGEDFGLLGDIAPTKDIDLKSEPLSALAAYREGAKVEAAASLSSTYCRLNELKFLLITGEERLGALKPRIRELADSIRERLKIDAKLSDGGWAWADLGDCRALLGDLDAAAAAYNSFIERSETRSPQTTLKILNELATAMNGNEDPEAGTVYEAAKTLEAELAGRG